jgi:hypothetical protein
VEEDKCCFPERNGNLTNWHPVRVTKTANAKAVMWSLFFKVGVRVGAMG